jgi:hypothetical protein
MLRGRAISSVYDNPDLTRRQKRRVVKELDCLLEHEQRRRAQLAAHQWQREELDHHLLVAGKLEQILRKYAEVASTLRLLKARTDRAVARYERDSLMCKIDVLERILQIRAKYKPAVKDDDHLQELLKIKRQQKLSEAREQAILESINRRAMNRAAFIRMINEKFPDMADELTDFYDQQIFQQGTGR